jgi:hypothetical protein
MAKLNFLLLLFSFVLHASGQDTAPIIDLSARVKEHRAGANGDLVAGEEEQRKIIIQWEEIPLALEYQVCHNCQATDEEGQLEPGETGKIHSVSKDSVRANRPVFVKPDTPLGRNTFHARASVKGEWGPWSKQRVFNVDEPGNAVHDEL